MATTFATTMRAQMVQTVEDVMARDERVMLVLADISRSLFKQTFEKYPNRAINVGIMEQTMVSVAAGTALEGFIPVVHSIAPFLVERPFEQLKDDFCYQRLGGNFISIGASYDYSVEGMTHHGPGDVAILRSLPGIQIVVPGSPGEFDALFREAYASGSPTYYRLSLERNPGDRQVQFGRLDVVRLDVVRHGNCATIVAVGPMLAPTLAAVEDLNVTVLYCTTVAPFDAETLRGVSASGDIILVEPYYAGALVSDILDAMEQMPVRIASIGMPHEVLSHYGTPAEHDVALGLTAEGIRKRIDTFLRG